MRELTAERFDEFEPQWVWTTLGGDEAQWIVIVNPREVNAEEPL